MSGMLIARRTRGLTLLGPGPSSNRVGGCSGEAVFMLCYYRRYKMESKKVDESLLTRIRAIVGNDGVVARDTELLVYECDGYTLERAVPQVVVLPRSTRQVSEL